MQIDTYYRTKRPNTYEVCGDVCKIYFPDGEYALIDTADLELVLRYRWYTRWEPCIRGFYVAAWVKLRDGRRTAIGLHTYLMKTGDGKYADHINHRTLDNRRENLRVVDAQGTQANRRGAQVNSKSGVRGVHLYTNRKTQRKYWRFWCGLKDASSTKTYCCSKSFPAADDGYERVCLFAHNHYQDSHGVGSWEDGS